MTTFEKDTKQKSNRGGRRENSGRKPGSKNKISKATAQTVIEMLYDKSGKVYEELLIEDFLNSRLNNDTTLTHKYHMLLSGKIMPTLNEVEIVESDDVVESKKTAFVEALAALSKINNNGDSNATN